MSELAELSAALDDVQSGRGRIVMLVGEPGIGKTRTAEAFADIAAARGFTTLWGRCPEQRGAPPYWPWAQIVRSCITRLGADTVRQSLASNAGVIAEVVAEISAVVPDVEEPLALSDPDSGRFRLFDAFATLLRNIAQDSPLVLVLDDLHWADRASLAMLEFVAHEQIDSRILILGTYRDTEVTRDHPLFHTLGDLTRSRIFSRVVLGGLNVESVGEMLDAESGGSFLRDISSAIHAQSEGNPLFVGEIARYLNQEGVLTGDGPVDLNSLKQRLPEGIREVIGRRLSRLSAYAKDVLTIAAFLGREFSLARLSAIAHKQSADELMEVLGEALASRLVEESASEHGSYQFTHALIQQALREELELLDRVRLHARVAEALEELYAENVDQHAPELAYHYSESETVSGTEKLIHYSIIAGEQALDDFAFEAALTHFSKVLAAQDERELDETKARTLRGIGISQAGGGQLVEAHDSLRAATDFYFEKGEKDQAIEIAVHPLMNIFSRLPDPVGRLSEILRVVEPGSIDEALLLWRFGLALSVDPDTPDQAVDEAFERAAASLNRHGAVSEEIWALERHVVALVDRLDLAQALKKCQTALKLADAIDDPLAEHAVIRKAVDCTVLLGMTEQAKQYGEQLRHAAQRTRSPHRELNAIVSSSAVLDALGDYDALLDEARTAEILVDRGRMSFGGSDYFGLPLAAARAQFERGEFEEGQSWLEKALDFSERNPGWPAPLSAVGHISRLTGRPDHLRLARAQLPRLKPRSKSADFRNPRYRSGMTLRIFIAAMEKDSDTARRIGGSMEKMPTVQHFGPCSARVLGLLAHLSGKPAVAAKHFEDSLNFCRKAGYRPELAWTCHDYAEMLLESPGTPDRHAVDALLDEGVAITEELGMVPLRERFATLREAAGEVQATHPAGLTDREVGVLKELASGKSNREIAETLFITRNTVIRHVANIFSKTGSANRAQAAVFAERNNLR